MAIFIPLPSPRSAGRSCLSPSRNDHFSPRHSQTTRLARNVITCGGRQQNTRKPISRAAFTAPMRSILAGSSIAGVAASFFAPKYLLDVQHWAPASVAALNFGGGWLVSVGVGLIAVGGILVSIPIEQ